MEFLWSILAILAILVFTGVKIVPQQQAWVVEIFGRFDKILQPGLNFIIPFVQRVAYQHSLKEQAVDVNQQTAITKDNVTLNIDGILYMKIVDPKAASYGVNNPHYALMQLAQTNMRSEIGKITLDNTFEERERLNVCIVNSINEASNSWGIQCMRYEIKDIDPPETVLQAMELQVAAERKKRAQILDSEGQREAKINIAEAQKKEVVLSSEGALVDQVNRAKGEAEAILAVSKATAEGITKVAISLQDSNGADAASLRVAERYIEAFEKLAKDSTTILLPADTGSASNMVAQALTIFDSIKGKNKK
jgi:regulator of protease activity HflC (stomatin/prohibitin superfamily)